MCELVARVQGIIAVMIAFSLTLKPSMKAENEQNTYVDFSSGYSFSTSSDESYRFHLPQHEDQRKAM